MRPVSKILMVAALLFSFAGTASAQPYPARAVRVIVPYPPGGGADFVTRVFGKALGDTMGQPFVIDNRAGANGVIAYSLAAKAPADGYTLVILSTPFPLNAALQRKLTYDSLTYASSGSGSVQHLAMELLRRLAGFEAVHVPYAGSAPAVVDLLGGHVQASITTLPAALPHTGSGRLRVLGILSATRVSRLPDIPTLVESGIAVIATGWGGIGAPAGVPRQIVRQLNEEIVRIVNLPDVRDRIVTVGGEPRHSSPVYRRRDEALGAGDTRIGRKRAKLTVAGALWRS